MPGILRDRTQGRHLEYLCMILRTWVSRRSLCKGLESHKSQPSWLWWIDLCRVLARRRVLSTFNFLTSTKTKIFTGIVKTRHALKHATDRVRRRQCTSETRVAPSSKERRLSGGCTRLRPKTPRSVRWFGIEEARTREVTSPVRKSLVFWTQDPWLLKTVVRIKILCKQLTVRIAVVLVHHCSGVAENRTTEKMRMTGSSTFVGEADYLHKNQ